MAREGLHYCYYLFNLCTLLGDVAAVIQHGRRLQPAAHYVTGDVTYVTWQQQCEQRRQAEPIDNIGVKRDEQQRRNRLTDIPLR